MRDRRSDVSRGRTNRPMPERTARWRWGGAVLLVWLFLAVVFVIEGRDLAIFTRRFAEVRSFAMGAVRTSNRASRCDPCQPGCSRPCNTPWRVDPAFPGTVRTIDRNGNTGPLCDHHQWKIRYPAHLIGGRGKRPGSAGAGRKGRKPSGGPRAGEQRPTVPDEAWGSQAGRSE